MPKKGRTRRFVDSSAAISVAIVAAMLLPVAIAEQDDRNGRDNQSDTASDVTFNKDVAPIFHASCVHCHRPGEVAPMSLVTYQSARPWARAVKRMVVERRMPPWLADPHYSSFSNDRRLTEKEIQTIVAWVDGGAREGNPADAPAPPQFADGWQIGVPDLVLAMKEPYTIPATGIVPWVDAVSEDYVFPEDVWVRAIEVRPGNRAVVHHAVAQANSNIPGESLHLFSPGMDAMIWRDGYGKLIRKGTTITFQMHYNVVGRETTDQTKVGFIFAKKPVHTQVHTTIVSNTSIVINHEELPGVKLSSLAPRGFALRPQYLRARTGLPRSSLRQHPRDPASHPSLGRLVANYYVLEAVTVRAATSLMRGHL